MSSNKNESELTSADMDRISGGVQKQIAADKDRDPGAGGPSGVTDMNDPIVLGEADKDLASHPKSDQ